jgi:hypothetical protein
MTENTATESIAGQTEAENAATVEPTSTAWMSMPTATPPST